MEHSYQLFTDIAIATMGVTLRNGLVLKEKGTLAVLQPRDFQDKERSPQPLFLEEYPMSFKRHQLVRGDLLLANKGTKYGTHLFEGDKPCIASAGFFVIRVRSEKCYPAFLQWYLGQPSAKDYFSNNSATSTIPSLSKATLDNLLVPLPPLTVQKAIIERLAILQRQEQLLTEMLRKLQEFRDGSTWEHIECQSKK